MKKHTSSLLILIALALSGNAQVLVHYWNFNSTNLETAKIPTLTLTNPSATMVVVPSSMGSQTPKEEVGTGQDFASFNARQNEAALQHFRLNDPVGGVITFNLPTIGYEKPVFSYVSRRSTQSARAQLVSYSLNGTDFIRLDSLVITEVPTLYSFDFTSIQESNDNANFKFRIQFVQVAGNGAGNNRFDNVSLDATPLGGGDIVPPTATLFPANNAMNIGLDQSVRIDFNEKVRLVGGKTFEDAFIFKLNSETGANVDFNASFLNDSTLVVTPASGFSFGSLYYFEINPNTIEDLLGNALTVKSFTSFRTISESGILAPGAIVPIAIQTNTTPSTPDRVAVLFLQDVAQGTAIQVTDAKFTSNNGQCPGGFTWFAPEGGVKAGEVVTFITENPISTSSGQVVGSGYGLSSGGEQVIFYMGSNTSPSHITAVSTNAWLAEGTTHTTCGGSISLRPTQLSDTSSIALVAGTGNVVNSFYNGSIDINTAAVQAIRASVLDRQNWVSAPSGLPQIWPNWSLAGPVRVLSHGLISSTQLRLVFSKDLNLASATNLSNYSGVAGLVAATMSNNGILADTVVLTFSSFADGVENTLTISGITAANGIGMSENASVKFTFTAASKVSFAQNFRVMTEGGNTIVTLNLDKAASGNVKLMLKEAPFSTASESADHDFFSQEVIFNNENSKVITINAIDDSENENDEYFVIELEGSEEIEVQGFKYVTVHIKDNDRKAPVATKEIELEHVTSFDPSPTGSTTEVIAYDPTTKMLYASSALQNRFDVIDFSDPANPVTTKSVSMSAYGNGITGVAVRNGLVAVGAPANPETLPGKVVFFTADGDYITDVTVGVLPDMVTFTPDGNKVLTADEGQPDTYLSGGTDPEGSVTVIDVSGGAASINQSKVKVISFQPFNANQAQYIAQGVRKTFKNSTLSQDLEPEYITFSEDSKKAWVICQENNAFVVLDLEKDTLETIWALGTKDYSQFGNGADMAAAAATQQNVLIANWPVKGYYHPDAIKSYTLNGKTYVVTANEGDEKEYGGLNERTTVGASNVVLDPVKFPHAAVLKQNYNIGGFRISNIAEYADPDNDGDYDELLSVGSRSFSIFDVDSKSLVYDSGDEFDYITSQEPTFGALFNASHDNNTFKSRSITKGCEPEALDIAEIDGKHFAFIGFERFGGVAVYNISNPENPVFVDYKNTRSLTSNSGDLGPEYVVYIDQKDSPDGKYYVLVSNEISGTITVFRLKGSILSERDVVINNKNNFYLYPNPAKASVKLSEERNVEVMDMSGMLRFKGLTNEINLENFSKGVYILKTNLGEIRKLVVE